MGCRFVQFMVKFGVSYTVCKSTFQAYLYLESTPKSRMNKLCILAAIPDFGVEPNTEWGTSNKRPKVDRKM